MKRIYGGVIEQNIPIKVEVIFYILLTADVLKNYHILVLGSPRQDLTSDKTHTIFNFIAEKGGNLLLFSNSTMMTRQFPCLMMFTNRIGFQLHEYHNEFLHLQYA